MKNKKIYRLNIRLGSEDIHRLEYACKFYGMSQSELIREAIRMEYNMAASAAENEDEE